ncbi:heme peroxidase, partial [Jimgerdemannia flammicorona]
QNITTTGLPNNTDINTYTSSSSINNSRSSSTDSKLKKNCGFDTLFIRTIDGSCNNLQVPTWGKAGNYYSRGPEGAQYARGTSSGHWQTVDSRVISNAVAANGQPPNGVGSSFGDEVLSDLPVSLMGVYFGQFINHDMENNKVTATREAFANVTNDWLFHCSPPGSNVTNFYNPNNDCFERSAKSQGDVVNGQFEVINKNNGWLDLSVIYSDNVSSISEY